MKATWSERLARSGVIISILSAVSGCSVTDGSPGESGENGAPGQAGEDGKSGSEGKAGALGADGKSGKSGPQGVQGEAGEVGQKGADGQDVVPPLYRLPPNGHALQVLSSIKTGGFDEGASEIVDYHPETRRVFVVNAALAQVQVLELDGFGLLSASGEVLDPASDLNGFDAGGVNSVSVFGNLVAVAVENGSKVMAGQVALYDAKNLSFISAVDVGTLPDMLAFSPDGSSILVANEGEQVRVVEGKAEEFKVITDPAGSISVIDLSAGADSPTVSSIDFQAFDGRLKEFQAKGLRYIPGELATDSSEDTPRKLSQDLEPEYISFSPDGRKAMVTLQENNALAVVDLQSDPPQVIDLRPLGVKDFSRDLPTLENIVVPDAARPVLLSDVATSSGSQDLLLGGLSGLYFEGEEDDVYSFVTVADRGPQLDRTELFDGHEGEERPHLMGDSYQAKIYRYEIDASDEEEPEVLGLPKEIPLFHDSDGDDSCTPVRGLANDDDLDAGEFAVDLQGNPLGFNPLDGDFEGVAIDPDGNGYWLVDEYRPAIYFFSLETSGCSSEAHGLLRYRLVPEGTQAAAGQALSVWDNQLDVAGETLPGRYLNRRANRGFEAVAIDPDAEVLYAFIQSPLDYEGARKRDVIRIVALDIDKASGTFGQPIAEHLYFLEGSELGSSSDKIGDAVFDRSTGKLFVIERDSSFGDQGNKWVFELDLRGADNTLSVDDSGAPFETLEIDELISTYGVRPVGKRKITNLPALGYTAGDKPEGLALIDEGALSGSLVVINDNDFGLEPSLDAGKVSFSTEYEKLVFGLIRFNQKNGLDASNKDDAIRISHHPVFGMYMPDSIASYQTGEQTYYVTANEGDSRDYDEARVRSLDEGSGLDASFGKVSDEDFGRLKMSVYDGDVDHDGDIDMIHCYGARSLSIWDSLGNLVWDSGSLIEEATSVLGDNFNSTNDENMSFDDRSDDKGPEPEGVVLGQIGKRWFAFLGLERVGGIMVFDITDPRKPSYVDYVTSRFFSSSVELGLAGDLGPEGLKFVPQEQSPTGMPLLIVGHEVSGTTTVFQIDL